MYSMQNNKSCKQDKHIHTKCFGGGGAGLRCRGWTHVAELFIQHSDSIATSTLFTMVTLSCQQVTLRPRPPAVAVMKTVMRTVTGIFLTLDPTRSKTAHLASVRWTHPRAYVFCRGEMYFFIFFYFYFKLSILVVAFLFGYWSLIGSAVVCLWSSCLCGSWAQ